MDTKRPSPQPVATVFGTSAAAFITHLLGTLTCATCWAIFGPALVLVFGSAGTALLATLRPYAPLAVAVSAIGIAYSIHQLARSRSASGTLPFKLAAVFTSFSAVSWTASAIYPFVTLAKG